MEFMHVKECQGEKHKVKARLSEKDCSNTVVLIALTTMGKYNVMTVHTTRVLIHLPFQNCTSPSGGILHLYIQNNITRAHYCSTLAISTHVHRIIN
jgi:hypothetical protein